MPVIGSFTGSGVAPQVASATALSSTVVRVTFSEYMTDNAALLLAGNYTLTPDGGSAARTVTSVVVEGSAPSLSVLLYLNGNLTAGTNNYQVLVTNVEDVAGNPLDLAFDTADFSGPSTSQQQAEINVGIRRPLTQFISAMGEELTDLAGIRSTRLTAQFLPEEQLESGYLNLDSVDGGYTATLNAGSFTDLAIGDEIRFTSVSPPVIATGTGLTKGALNTVFLIGDVFPISKEGVGNTLSAAVGPNQTLTDAESEFTTAVIGQNLYVRDAANPVNEGLFPITAAPTATTLTITNAAGVLETSSFVWSINGVHAGDFLRITSGDWTDLEIEIESVDSDERLTLIVEAPDDLRDVDWEVVRKRGIVRGVAGGTAEIEHPGLGDDFANLSWEGWDLADTTAQVESTYNWQDSGKVVIGDTTFTYAGKTQTSLTDMEHWDGETWRPGADVLYSPIDEVVDISHFTSGMDLSWRSFMSDWATGSDLDVIGRNLGVRRPPSLSDDEKFRNLIQTIAYGSRGTLSTLQDAMDALLGAGNYELFEDMTGSDVVGTDLQHNNTVYIRPFGDEEEFVGKTFVDGYELVALSSTTAATLGATPLEVFGAEVAPEPGMMGERVIEIGTAQVTVNDTTPGTVTHPAAGFSTRIKTGDEIVLTSGPHKGSSATIITRTSASALDVASVSELVQGTPFRAFSFTGEEVASYKIIRPFSNFRYYKPTEESYIVTDSGSAVVQWVYNDPANEVTEATLQNDATYGRFLEITSNATRTYYDHALRILPESNAALRFVISYSNLATGATDYDQVMYEIQDGERRIAVGLRGSGANALVAFCTPATGAIIGVSSGLITAATNPYAEFSIIKRGRNAVELYQGQTLVSSVPHASFAATGAVTDRRIRFGSDTTKVARVSRTKALDWFTDGGSKDLWNVHFTNAETQNTDEFEDLAAGAFFAVGDVGKTIRIKTSTERRALGEWEIKTRINANTVEVIGKTHKSATFVPHARRRLTIRDDKHAFIYPSHDNPQTLEILAPSVNAGTHIIQELQDPITFGDIGDKYPTSQAGGIIPTDFVEYTNTLEVTGASALFSGFDEDASWRLLPTFPATAATAELVDAGSVAGAVLTFRQNLNVHGLATGEVILVKRSRVLSGYLSDMTDDNEFDDPDYAFYPFYLYDGLGSAADIMDLLLAAGVLPGFEKLVRDSAGLHILE